MELLASYLTVNKTYSPLSLSSLLCNLKTETYVFCIPRCVSDALRAPGNHEAKRFSSC